MQVNIGFLLFLFLVSMSSMANESNSLRTFFEAMTYPNDQWRADDFGLGPTTLEAELLKKHAPQFSIDKTACSPMNFYQQYVPLLYFNKADKIIFGSRENLKKYERNSTINWQLIKKPSCIQSKTPPLYAYAWKESMALPSGSEENIRVLKYAFTFYKSGLPKKQTVIQELGRLLGDPDTWHYLDIHGAVFYLLNAKNKIFSVVLAQHNHFRSYIIGVDVTEKNAKKICFAIRSNEPYFCGTDMKRAEYATAPTSTYIRWIISQNNKPVLGAWDVIPDMKNRKTIEYELTFLSDKDPLITSWNSLGPEIKIWGLFSTFYRNSPPGMSIFNTPQLKQLWKTAQYYYFDPVNDKVFDLHEDNMQDFFNQNVEPVLQINAQRFEKSLTITFK